MNNFYEIQESSIMKGRIGFGDIYVKSKRLKSNLGHKKGKKEK